MPRNESSLSLQAIENTFHRRSMLVTDMIHYIIHFLSVNSISVIDIAKVISCFDKNYRNQCDEAEESGQDNLMSHTSKSFLTALKNHSSPRVRERSPTNMTSSKTL